MEEEPMDRLEAMSIAWDAIAPARKKRWRSASGQTRRLGNRPAASGLPRWAHNL